MAVNLQLVGAPATECLGACVARLVKAPACIWLQGALGSGKTTFCRGFIRALSAAEKVASPTYALLETYAAKETTICHFDLYRISKPDELEFIGVRDCFADDNICLIEWPENAGALPPPDLKITLTYADKEQERHAAAEGGDTQLIQNIRQDYMRQCTG